VFGGNLTAKLVFFCFTDPKISRAGSDERKLLIYFFLSFFRLVLVLVRIVFARTLPFFFRFQRVVPVVEFLPLFPFFILFFAYT